MTGQCGQSLVEFIVAHALILAVVVMAGRLLGAEWERFRCAHEVFERTHGALIGRRILSGYRNIAIEDLPDRVTGTGLCGGRSEKVVLWKLESQAP